MIDQEGIKIELEVIDQDAQVMLVSVSGYVDQANCYLMQETIDKCLADKFFRLVFDLQKLMYMSSAGWGVLIGEIKRFRENGGDIKLANMGPEIYEIYQMLEFYHIISEYPSAEDALNSFNIKSANFSEEESTEEAVAEEEEPAVAEGSLPEEVVVEGEQAVAEESSPEEEVVESEAPAVEETPAEADVEEVDSSEEELAEEATSEELVEEDASLSESETSVEEESSAESLSESEEISEEGVSEEDEETIEEVSVKEIEVDLEDDEVNEEDGIEELPDKESDEEAESEEAPEPEKQVYYIEEDSIDEEPIEEEKPKKTGKSRRHKESAHLEKTPEKKDTSDDNPQVILEDEIDINIEGFLANEGIAISGPRKDKSNYVEFNPDKYQRKFDIKVMPIPDKIRDIVGRNPELSPRQIRSMLKNPEYGNVKISYFKFKSLLKALELDTKQKRYRYYRSA